MIAMSAFVVAKRFLKHALHPATKGLHVGTTRTPIVALMPSGGRETFTNQDECVSTAHHRTLHLDVLSFA